MGDHRSSYGIRLDDGTFWPSPEDPRDVQHTLRYGTPSQIVQVALFAAEYVASYQALFDKTAKRRGEVVRRIKAVCKADPIGGHGNG